MKPSCPGCGVELGCPFTLKAVWAFWCDSCKPAPPARLPQAAQDLSAILAKLPLRPA